MGGLVIKTAFILGHHLDQFKSVVERVGAMIFLACPHQGSDISQSLNRILSLHGSRPFVNDLFPSSPAIQLINDEFPSLSTSIRLFSFFETRPMNYIIGKGLIVEKHAAVLNYPNERRSYLDANHRDVARFFSPDDPSYRTVRNALATLVNEQHTLSRAELEAPPSYTEKLGIATQHKSALGKSLCVDDTTEEEWMTLDSVRMPGSCEWLLQRTKFIKWHESLSPGIYWLRGRPGAGKSVTSSVAISHLRELRRDCCFYFFVGRDRKQASTSAFLRSMAFQMGVLHPEICSTILEITSSWGEGFTDRNDANVIWRKLFLHGILKVQLSRPQFWVIDALDEARGGQELMNFLAKAQEFWPLGIFITSRNSAASFEITTNTKVEVIGEEITENETDRDISLLLNRHFIRFPAPTAEERRNMADLILRNSKGCFLWAQLVVKELLQVQTIAQAERVLQTNPSDMNDLYTRIVREMKVSTAEFNRELVRSILALATCCGRPLYMDELREAIDIYIQDTVGDIERSIGDFCGNLVYVDKMKRLQLVHATARDFLLRENTDTEFAVERLSSHRRLSMACMDCFIREPTKSCRNPRGFGKPVQPLQPDHRSPFLSYAAEFLFHHLSHSRASDDELLDRLAAFLGSSNGIHSWIEYVAGHFNLQKIYQAGKTITQLLERRAQHSPPIGLRSDLSRITRWANDLPHLVTRFGKQLISMPSSIHRLIPPFCPAGSVVREQFNAIRGMSVHGVQAQEWDECISTIPYHKPERPTAIVASSESIAVGTSTGKVVLYDHQTLQESQVVEQKEPVWTVVFSADGKLLAIASSRSIRVWSIERRVELRTFPVKALCLALAFDEDGVTLWAAMRNNMLICWDIDTGEMRRDPANWTIAFAEEGSELHARAPVTATFCIHMRLLAIVYRGEDLILWDLDEDHIYDIYEKDTGSRLNDIGSIKIADGVSTVWAVAFSAAVGTTLVAAAYHDGDLIVYDSDTGLVTASASPSAQYICSSPDGRTLAAGDSNGNIQLLDFLTLKTLSQIQFHGGHGKVRSLAFTSDNQRLIEVRGNQCRIWQPTVLLREDGDDDPSDLASISTAPLEIEFREHQNPNSITSIFCLQSASLVFCAKSDGTVWVYDIAQVELEGTYLFTHSEWDRISALWMDEDSSLLLVQDTSSSLTCRWVRRRPDQQGWDVSGGIAVGTEKGAKIQQVLASEEHSRLLISAEGKNVLWSIREDSRDNTVLAEFDAIKGQRLVSHRGSGCVILVEKAGAQVYNWKDLSRVSSISFKGIDPPSVSRLISWQHHRYFATIAEGSQGATPNQQSAMHIWDKNDFVPTAALPSSTGFVKAVRPIADLGPVTTKILQVIGIVGDHFIFLDKDFWICSVDLNPTRASFRKCSASAAQGASGAVNAGRVEGAGQRRRRSAGGRDRDRDRAMAEPVEARMAKPVQPTDLSSPPPSAATNIGPTDVTRHFFVPSEWISPASNILVGVCRDGEVVFAGKSELAVVKRGLDIFQGSQVNPRRHSSPLRGFPARRPGPRGDAEHTVARTT